MQEEIQRMINAVGFAIVGDDFPNKVGSVFGGIRNDDGETVRHPFTVIGEASEEEIKRAAIATGLKFNRVPGRCYYKVITD